MLLATRHSRRVPIPGLLIVAALCSPGPLARGAEADPPAAAETPAAISVADPEIPTDRLDLLLKPLRKDELLVEAEAWISLVRDKVREISNAEIAVKVQNEEIDRAEAIEEAAEDAREAREAAEEARASGSGSDAEEAAQEAEDAARALEDAAADDTNTQDPARAAADDAVRDALKPEPGGDQPAPEGAAPDADSAGAAGTADAAGAPSGAPGELEKTKADARAAADSKAELKKKLLTRITELENEREALVARARLVLKRLEAKGGDPAEFKLYLDAVTGFDVDVTDASAAWAKVTGWLTSPEYGLKYGKNLAVALVVLVAFVILSRFVSRAVRRALRVAKRTSTLLQDFLVNTVRRVIVIIGILIALSALGVNVGPLMAVIGAAGFVVAFALQGTLSNFASGIMILLYRPFDVGDVIDVASVAGKVDALTLFSTHIKTFDNKSMIVPNNSIWGNVITNATAVDIRRVDMVFGIGYDDDIDKAQSILESIIQAHELVLEDPEPTIRMNELADSSVNFIVRPWAKTGDYWSVYWDVTREVKKRFDAEGVSIPFPQRDVHIYQQSTQDS